MGLEVSHPTGQKGQEKPGEQWTTVEDGIFPVRPNQSPDPVLRLRVPVPTSLFT